jgi:hypothetical protein
MNYSEFTIKVALDTTTSPKVVVIPKHPTLPRHVKITRIPIGSAPFTFTSFKPAEDPGPFSGIVCEPLQITAYYDANAAGEHGYTIEVAPTPPDGQVYSSDVVGNGGGPTIRNK